LHFVVGGLVLDAEAEQGGAFKVLDGKYFGEGIPETSRAFGTAVVVAEDYAAGFYYLEGLGGFGGEAGGLIAGVAENDFGGGVVGAGVPGIETAKDLLDFAFKGLIPVVEADLVLAGNGREVQGDDFAAGRKVQCNVEGGAAFGGAKLDDAFRLKKTYHVREDH